MPQMSPMWWSVLYTIFITCFIMVLIMMYFNINMKIQNQENKMLKKKIKWTW